MTLRRDEYGKPVGLDWAALSPTPQKASEGPDGPDTASTAVVVRKTPTKPRKASTRSSSSLGNHAGGPAPTYDPAKVAELYHRGMTPGQIAKELGAQRSTIYRRLNALGIYRASESKYGPPRKTHCIRDHEFTEENTRELPGGGRSCKECERIRGRKAYKDGEAV